MKTTLLSLLLAFALVFSACNKENGINSPNNTGHTSTAFLKAADQLNFSNEQLAFVDEMVYLNEDLSLLLSPAQITALSSALDDVTPRASCNSSMTRGFRDMGAIMYYRVIVQANPDMDSLTKVAIKKLIETSSQTRSQILKDNLGGDPKAIQLLFKEEHDKLIAAINALLTPDQLSATTALQAKIEADRAALRAKWAAVRVAREVSMLTQLLTLTTDQQSAITTILTNRDTQIAALRAQYKGDPEGFRTALIDLQTRTDTSISALLTTDQLVLWTRWNNGLYNPRIGGLHPHGHGRRW